MFCHLLLFPWNIMDFYYLFTKNWSVSTHTDSNCSNFHFRVENLCTVYRHLSQKTQATFISKKIYMVQRGVMLMAVIINTFPEFYNI